MAMVVQHNMTAMNANRQLGVITSGQAKSSEKLSSGYRINRAGDDAAGLKISEKMRSQVRGLTRASTNAQDGVSLIQTAEGALNEAHSILQRMNELAVQGANDTNESIDRDAINEELEQLTEELDRISSTTQFNKMNLLDGTFQNKNLHVGANTNQKIAISIDNMDATSLGLKSIAGAAIPGDALGPQTGVSIVKVNYGGNSYTYDSTKTFASNKLIVVSTIKGAISDAAASTQYKQQIDLATGSAYYIRTGSPDTRYATASAAMASDVAIAKGAVSDAFESSFATYLQTEKVTAASATVETTPGSPAVTANNPSVSSYALANATIAAVQEAIK